MPLNNHRTSIVKQVHSAFIKDAIDLFSKTRQGHMEKWEYASARYKNDPASGADAWARLIINPGQYYPPQGDIETIRHALTGMDMVQKLATIEHVVELGPGCRKSILQKTLPVLKAAISAKTYTAIDATVDVEHGAARIVREHSNVECYGQAMDFFEQPFNKSAIGPTAVIFWGSTLGNFDGMAGEDPFSKLTGFLHNVRQGLAMGDSILFSFDSEKNERAIIDAYSEPMMSAQILSVLHQMPSHISAGNFDPYLWRHRPIWIEETMQCAHIIYPMVDQQFMLGGREFLIKAYEPILSNNSYKYSPARVKAAALMAGYINPRIVQKGAMALLSADC